MGGGGSPGKEAEGKSVLCAGKVQAAESCQVESGRGLGEQVAQPGRGTGRSPEALTSRNGWSFLEYRYTFSLLDKQQLFQSLLSITYCPVTATPP